MKLDEKDVFISFQDDIASHVNDLNTKLNQTFRMSMQHNNQREASQLTLNVRNAYCIRKSKIFLCCLTNKYAQCVENRKELIYALRLEKRNIVLNFDQVNIKHHLDISEFNLESVQHIQFNDYDLIKESIEIILKVTFDSLGKVMPKIHTQDT